MAHLLLFKYRESEYISSVIGETFPNMAALLVFVSLLAILITLIYFISKKKFSYWEKKNVPFIKPLPILGNYAKFMLLKQYPGQLLQELCRKFPNQPYFGAFYGTEPVLVVQSPEIVKDVLTKDFYYFNGREASHYASKEIATNNLFFASNDMWKVTRQNLTALFSSAKMKKMFYLIENCSHALEDMLEYGTTTRNNVIESRDLGARYTMDCICSCAFGIESKAMGYEANNIFRIMATQIFEASNTRGLKTVLRAVWPAIFYGMKMQLFPSSIDEFFSKLLKGVFESRNHKPSHRNDFVDLVLTLKNDDYLVGDSIANSKTGKNEKVRIKVDDELLVAQCILFFGAGFETSSTTISFTLYELAKNQKVQNRVIEEIDEYCKRRNNKLVYECINELPYLSAAMYETLRMYPIFGVLTREVMDDYEFSTGLRVDKGVRVHIPIYHIHFNPDYFPDPEEYKPERFLPENKKDMKPYTFFPYGEGPRICIGSRFAKMQVMAGLMTILKEYRVELADGMPQSIKLDPRTLVTAPLHSGIQIKYTKREGWENRRWVRT
ncbi:cytochrome P450 6k1-like [Trichoplusia ni]|uniref:unspecific monooxygenase n=1 Tax=Trichoplusia ni TaxID=7111 RepID=A0A7E5WI73_TRINI|nr:cytochrome P450 6k1-like [Trichoplusia ni]XP_026740471.1 cytochrome P450 6k1-like [Trichoplusia ni]